MSFCWFSLVSNFVSWLWIAGITPICGNKLGWYSIAMLTWPQNPGNFVRGKSSSPWNLWRLKRGKHLDMHGNRRHWNRSSCKTKNMECQWIIPKYPNYFRWKIATYIDMDRFRFVNDHHFSIWTFPSSCRSLSNLIPWILGRRRKPRLPRRMRRRLADIGRFFLKMWSGNLGYS